MEYIKLFSSNLPGFRTNNIWKKIIAVHIYVALLIITFFTAFFGYVNLFSVTDYILAAIDRVLLLIAFFYIPFFWFSNIKDFRSKFMSFVKTKNSIFRFICVMLIVTYSYFILNALGGSFYSPQYKSIVAENNRIRDEKEAKEKAERVEKENAKKQVDEAIKAQQYKEKSEKLAAENVKKQAESEAKAEKEKQISTPNATRTPPTETPNNSKQSITINPSPSTNPQGDYKGFTFKEKEQVLNTLEKMKPFDYKNVTIDHPFFQEEYFKLTIDTKSDYIYVGEIKDATPHGTGMLFLRDNKSTSGEIIYYPIYIGQWKYGRFEGFGVHNVGIYDTLIKSYVNDTRLYKLICYKDYEGYFRNGKFEGKGNMFFSPEGNLVYYFRNQPFAKKSEVDDYYSQFNDQSLQGFRIISPMDISDMEYTGEFRNSKKDGYGKLFSYENHSLISYEGYFKDDKSETT